MRPWRSRRKTPRRMLRMRRPEETASLAPIQTSGPSEESKGPSATDNGTEDGASRSYIWLIIVIAVAVLAAVVVVVIIRSRKKSA